MSNNDFDRAVNFLQGALDVAVSESKEDRGPMLPGFGEQPGETSPERPVEQGEKTSATSAAKAPDGASREGCPSTGKARCACNGRNKIIIGSALALLFGVSAAAAFRLISPRIVVNTVTVEKEVQVEPDGIPLALLPESAEQDLWETVANMSGEIDGTALSFKRGIASANGAVYKVVLDFCRGGESIYVRVNGPKRYVVCLNGQGKIVKAYPAPKNNRPLKEIFGK